MIRTWLRVDMTAGFNSATVLVKHRLFGSVCFYFADFWMGLTFFESVITKHFLRNIMDFNAPVLLTVCFESIVFNNWHFVSSKSQELSASVATNITGSQAIPPGKPRVFQLILLPKALVCYATPSDLSAQDLSNLFWACWGQQLSLTEYYVQ